MNPENRLAYIISQSELAHPLHFHSDKLFPVLAISHVDGKVTGRTILTDLDGSSSRSQPSASVGAGLEKLRKGTLHTSSEIC